MWRAPAMGIYFRRLAPARWSIGSRRTRFRLRPCDGLRLLGRSSTSAISLRGLSKGVAMHAGYLVGQYIQNKLNTMGFNAVVAWLASKVGANLAKKEQ